MPISFSTFGGILSELQSSLQEKIPRAVLYPLAMVAVTMTLISGYAYGFGALDAFWKATTAFEKLVVAALVVLGFVLAAYVLSAWQGVLERMFLGVLPSWLSKPMLRHHRETWRQCAQTVANQNRVDGLVETAYDHLASFPLVKKSAVSACHALPRHHCIAEGDVEYSYHTSLPEGTVRSLQHARSRLTTRAIQSGTVLTEADLLSLPESGLANRVLASALFAPGAVPDQLAVGNVVWVYRRGWRKPRRLDRHGWLVTAIESTPAGTIDHGPLTLKLTFAVPEAEAGRTIRVPVQDLNVVMPPTSLPGDVSTPPPGKIQVSLRSPTGEQADPASLTPAQLREKLTWIEQQIKAPEPDWLAGAWTGTGGLIEEAGRYADVATWTTALLNLTRPEAECPPSLRAVVEESEPDLQARRTSLLTLLDEARTAVAYRRNRDRKYFAVSYPQEEAAVVPTAVGNVLGAVDSYGERLYGLDTELVLPRLRTVISKDALGRLDAAHEHLMMLMWTWLGLVTVGVGGTIVAVSDLDFGLALLVWASAFPLAKFVGDHAAPGAALGYAEQLRVALDAERGKVPGLLGISVENPTDMRSEKQLWRRIGQWWRNSDAPGPYVLTPAVEASGKANGPAKADSKKEADNA